MSIKRAFTVFSAAAAVSGAVCATPASAADLSYGYAGEPGWSYGPAPMAPAAYDFDHGYAQTPAYAYGPRYYGPRYYSYGTSYSGDDESAPLYPTPRVSYGWGYAEPGGYAYSPSVASEYVVVPAQPGLAYRAQGYAYGDQGISSRRIVKKHVRVTERRSRSEAVRTKSRERAD